MLRLDQGVSGPGTLFSLHAYLILVTHLNIHLALTLILSCFHPHVLNTLMILIPSTLKKM